MISISFSACVMQKAQRNLFRWGTSTTQKITRRWYHNEDICSIFIQVLKWMCLNIGYTPKIHSFSMLDHFGISHVETHPNIYPILICNIYIYICRRKFRSETSDNMDSWKAEVRRVRREKIRRKKMQMREKVGKSRFTVFFQWFVAPEGRKVGSLKRRVRTQLARWEMKKCTPLWREAHFQVKMYKTHQCRTTFGSWDVEKVHAVVARSTFASQNV